MSKNEQCVQPIHAFMSSCAYDEVLNTVLRIFLHAQGHTPLMLAALCSTPELVHQLLGAGADVSIKDTEVTMHHACSLQVAATNMLTSVQLLDEQDRVVICTFMCPTC